MSDTNISVSTTRRAVHQVVASTVNDLVGVWADIIAGGESEITPEVARETMALIKTLCLQSGFDIRDFLDLSDMIAELEQV